MILVLSACTVIHFLTKERMIIHVIVAQQHLKMIITVFRVVKNLYAIHTKIIDDSDAVMLLVYEFNSFIKNCSFVKNRIAEGKLAV